MRKIATCIGIVLLALTTPALYAQAAFGGSGFTSSNNLTLNATPFYNTDSGWIASTGIHLGGNTNYATGYGNSYGYYTADYFSFDLTGLTGTVSSASLNLSAYNISNPGPFDIFATILTPAEVNSSNSFTNVGYYSALLSGTEIGTVGLTPAESGGTVTVTLNAAGLAWLQANEGNGVVVGGAFAPPVPEPGSLVMLGTGILGLAGALRRKAKL